MSIKQFMSVAAMAIVTGLAGTSALAQITVPTVLIGNPGNEADVVDGDQNASGVQRLGSVAYAYNIGTYEVTNAQYTAFLNAKAATDTFILYNFQMSGAFGGITRSGSPGSYTFATVSGRANNPVNFVSFWDACRFANWLHNGQGVSGDTETGAYTLTAGGISANTITRNAGWQWAVTNENEWYKAAYHQPASEGGDSDNYWLYPTQSNAVPTTAQVNYLGVIGNTRPVGSYAANYYGTFDMGGNVSEWNESRTSNTRNYRGGSFSGNENFLQAVSRNQSAPSTEASFVGFRVVIKLATLTANLQLLDTIGSFAATRQITYTAIQNSATIVSGVITVNASSSLANIILPASLTGAATLLLDGSSFLRRAVAINLTGSSQNLGQVNLTNGDADPSGEVDAADIDLVIADFGSTAVGNSDVDVSGEVDAADIDIVIASFGSVDE